MVLIGIAIDAIVRNVLIDSAASGFIVINELDCGSLAPSAGRAGRLDRAILILRGCFILILAGPSRRGAPILEATTYPETIAGRGQTGTGI